MSNDDENSKLLEQYQKMLKMCLGHMKHCGAFEKEVLEEFDFDE